MIHTKHSQARKQQRGIKSEDIKLVLDWGVYKRAGKKHTKVFLTKARYTKLMEALKKTKSNLFQRLDKLKKLVLIISEIDNVIVTVYK